ncbi:glycosyltransferase family 4 protein [bacterium]|nr:glycosyltransferase family 4 protein [bacterium]
MKLLIATPLFPPDIGGPATYSKILFEELPKRGILVELLLFGSVRRLPKGISHFAYFILLLWRARGCDIVFALDPVSVGFPAMYAAKILRKRFFLKIVGDFAWEQEQVKSGKLKVESKFVSLEEFQEQDFDLFTNLRKKVERYVARQAEKIVVPSEYLKKIILLWGVPEEKISVIYNAFEPAEVNERRDELKKKFDVPGPMIVTAGRLVPWKGIDALIEIFPDILAVRHNTRLVIAGEGPEMERLKVLARDKTPAGSVVFTGRLVHEKLVRYVKAADVFVLNSSYEGFSHLLIEALAIGTPIVATNIGGNPELITDGETGFLVEYGDTGALLQRILAVLDISDFQRKFAKNGKEKVKSFMKERMVGELIEQLG